MMDQKYTLWNMPSNSWDGVPKDLKVTDELEKKVKAAMAEPASDDDLRPYQTPVDQEQMAKIIG